MKSHPDNEHGYLTPSRAHRRVSSTCALAVSMSVMVTMTSSLSKAQTEDAMESGALIGGSVAHGFNAFGNANLYSALFTVRAAALLSLDGRSSIVLAVPITFGTRNHGYRVTLFGAEVDYESPRLVGGLRLRPGVGAGGIYLNSSFDGSTTRTEYLEFSSAAVYELGRFRAVARFGWVIVTYNGPEGDGASWGGEMISLGGEFRF